jgi:hypothetical protein
MRAAFIIPVGNPGKLKIAFQKFETFGMLISTGLNPLP